MQPAHMVLIRFTNPMLSYAQFSFDSIMMHGILFEKWCASCINFSTYETRTTREDPRLVWSTGLQGKADELITLLSRFGFTHSVCYFSGDPFLQFTFQQTQQILLPFV